MKCAALSLVALLILTPILWLFVSSLKTTPKIIARPPVWLPGVPQWRNYMRVFAEIPMLGYYLNSFLIAGSVSLFVLFTSSLSGYALSKFKFPGRNLIFKGILATMMIPSILFIIPMYYLMLRMPLAGGNDFAGLGGSGFLHSHMSLIFPFVVSAWGIFLLRQFFMSVPDDLLSAARIDGCAVILFLLLQRYYMQGITLTGLKE